MPALEVTQQLFSSMICDPISLENKLSAHTGWSDFQGKTPPFLNESRSESRATIKQKSAVFQTIKATLKTLQVPLLCGSKIYRKVKHYSSIRAISYHWEHLSIFKLKIIEHFNMLQPGIKRPFVPRKFYWFLLGTNRSSADFQRVLEDNVSKRTGRNYGPEAGKRLRVL